MESLYIGQPCDASLEERRARIERLIEHAQAEPVRRTALFDYLNRLGHLVDNRPYASPAEAVTEARSAGLLLSIDGEGRPAAHYAGSGDDELVNGWPAKRALYRFGASCRRPDWAAEIAALIRANSPEGR